MSLPLLTTLATTIALALGPGLQAQASLPDRTTVVATTQGLFVVPPNAEGTINTDPLALQVATPADFGGTTSISTPSVAWIDYSNTLMVTTGVSLFRVTLTATGQVSFIQHVADGSFTDIEYSAGMDTLFLLDAAAGTVHSLFSPGNAANNTLSLWNDTLVPGDAIDLAITRRPWPFSLEVLAHSGFLRLREAGLPPKLDYTHNDQWVAHDTMPGNNVRYVADGNTHNFGMAFINGMDNSINGAAVSNACHFPPIMPFIPFLQPLDIASEGRNPDVGFAGMVVITNTINPAGCLNHAQGPNHVGRFPTAWPVFNPISEVHLLTPHPASGIAGSQPDIDHIRIGSRGVTPQGWPKWTADHAFRPEMKQKISGDLILGVRRAPPGQLAALVLHVILPGQSVPISTLTPENADAISLHVTSQDGQVPLDILLPADPIMNGARAVVQWYVKDPSAVAGSDPAFVNSQRVVYNHGAP